MINIFDRKAFPKPLGFIKLGIIPAGLELMGFPLPRDPLVYQVDSDGYYRLIDGSLYKLVDGAYYKVSTE